MHRLTLYVYHKMLLYFKPDDGASTETDVFVVHIYIENFIFVYYQISYIRILTKERRLLFIFLNNKT